MLTSEEHHRLLALYRETRLEFQDGEEWYALNGSMDPVCVLSAWNPWGKLLGEVENEKQDRILHAHLLSYHIKPQRARGFSHDGTWREDGWVFPIQSHDLILKLLHAYRQYAAFMLISDQRWVMWNSGHTERIL